MAISADGALIGFNAPQIGPRRTAKTAGPAIAHCRVIVLESATGKVIQPGSEFEAENKRDEKMAFSPDGKLVAIGAWQIRLFDVKTGELIHQFDGHRNLIISLEFSSDGKRLLSASKDGTAVVWDVSK
jgi:WD40 repeat protein